MENSSYLWVTFIVWLITNCLSLPICNNHEMDPELTGGFFGGDMIIPQIRNGILNPARRWPLGEVYYSINVRCNQTQRDIILNSMRAVENVSCIRFYEANVIQNPNYVEFLCDGVGCNSKVGYQAEKQLINLEPPCFKVPGKITHEILHCLGFFHQHMVFDRDDYVEIMFENIRADAVNFFRIIDNTTATSYNTPYDYESIMHYGPYAFSSNGLATIVPKQPNVTIGQRNYISRLDACKINRMYECNFNETICNS